MADVTLELQKAVYDALVGTSPPVVAGSRVYDRVPEAVVYPYVTFGAFEALSDDADCLTAFTVTFQLNIWSTAVGYPEVKALADLVRRALHEADLPLASNALAYLAHRQTRIFRDDDLITSQAALTFVADIEQT